MSIWQRLLDRFAPVMPADLSRLDRLDGRQGAENDDPV